MSANLPDRNRSNSYEYQPKRVRKGSISGRLRTASDLEELGYIDRTQKGMIKDLIISGDTQLQMLMDKYEQGDGHELLALIKDGYLSMRKPSIELIEGLDFDFINALRDDDEEHNDGGFFADLDAEFGTTDIPAYTSTNRKDQTGATSATKTDEAADLLQNHSRSRRASLDALLLHNFIFDDHVGQLPSGDDFFLHDYGVHGDGIGGSNDVFNDLFQQFSSAAGGGGEGNGAPGGGSNIDLSAYAQHAATLQHGKHMIPTGPKNAPLSVGGAMHPNKGNGPAVAAGTSSSKKHPGATVAPGSFPNPHGSYVYNSGHTSSGNHVYAPTPTPGYPYNTNLGTLPNPNILPNNNNGSYGLGSQGQMQPGMSVSASAMNAAAQRPSGFIGAYSPEQRRQRIEKFLEKRARRVWSRKVKYDVRKNFADSRLRIKGRFVKKEDEDMMRELMNM
jgi:hypothetical protein